MLTDLKIRTLPLPEKPKEYADGRIRGLYLAVQPSGARSWVLRYRVGARTRKYTIGAFPTIGLSVARQLAQAALGDIALGKDPAAAKQASRAAAKAECEADVDLVERAVDVYVERHAKRETRDWQETQRLLLREFVAYWKGRRLSSIGRPDIYQRLDEIGDRGSPSTARHAFAAFRAMCGWSVSRGTIERNPCDGVAAPAAAPSRDRTFSDAETGLSYRAFQKLGFPFGSACLLFLLTGQRKSEVSGLKWSELDFAARTWRLPKERSKNGREHTVPLSDPVIAILEDLPRFENCDLVFTTTGRTPVTGWSKAKTHLDAVMLGILRDEAAERGDDPDKVSPPPPWTLHDIRRSVATGLQKLGVRLEVTEAILNHTSGSRGGIVGVYQRYGFEPEKVAALAAWAEHVAAILAGKPATTNVVEIAKARA